MGYKVWIRYDQAVLQQIKEYLDGCIEFAEEAAAVAISSRIEKMVIEVTHPDSNQISIAFWGKLDRADSGVMVGRTEYALTDIAEGFVEDFGYNVDDVDVENFVPHWTVQNGEFTFGATMDLFPSGIEKTQLDLVGFQDEYRLTV